MTIDVEVYGKTGCAQCQAAKAKLSHFLQKHEMPNVHLNFVDMGTPDGLAEGAFNDVFNIPTTIVRAQDDVLARWEECVPTTEEFATSLGQARA